MSIDGERRLHERLDGIADDIGVVKADVKALKAVCGVCRPIVLGGEGRKPIDSRVSSLENDKRFRNRGYWALVALVSGIIVVLVGTLAAVLAKSS